MRWRRERSLSAEWPRAGDAMREEYQSLANERVQFPALRGTPPPASDPTWQACSQSALDGLAERFGPDFSKGIHIALYHEGSTMLDAKVAANDGADALNSNLILCRNFVRAGKQCLRKRYYGARTAFAEKRCFGGHTVGIELDIGGKAVAIETGFSNG